jgi:hypothetical protein
MSDYLSQQSVGAMFRNAVQISFKHASSVLLPYFLLQSLVLVPYLVALLNEDAGTAMVFLFLSLPVGFFAYGIMVVSVSEICLGTTPSIFRSFNYVFGKVLGKLVVTNLLQVLVIVIGLILLIVPGLLFMFWFILAPVVVILDGKWGLQALQRSKTLASGYHMRTLGIILLWMLVSIVLGGVVGGVLGVIAAAAEAPFLLVLGITAIQLFFQVFIIVTLILMYYDLRVRKEAYNTSGLAEDLAR